VLEHFGRAVAEGFTCAVVVTDPSYNALSVARESAALARQLGIPHIILAVNRVHGDTDIQKVRGRLRDLGEFPRVIVVPFNPDIFLAEPDVTPLLAADSPFRNEIRRLAEMIAGRCEAESGMV
jgi:CO dehydrogenase maturation factor